MQMELALCGGKGGTLWKHNMSRKFGVEGGRWCTREVREGYGVGLWKEIRKEEYCLKKLFSLWGMVEE